MRVGMNPLRAAKTKRADIVLSVIVHLPNFAGYHARRFEVVKTCINTMRQNAGMEHQLLVWDNGSNVEVKEWLRDEVKPDYLIHSVNIGTQAKKAIMSMLPPDTIVNYSDDDMLYSPDWLAPQLELLNHFPNVAAVSGYVVRTAFRWGCENTIEWARSLNILKSGKILSEDSEREFCKSIGRNYEEHKTKTVSDMDYTATYNGKTAFLTAHHCQVLGRAGTLAQASRWGSEIMPDEKPFDIALDNLGLRLGTIKRLVRHIGNVPD